jgi:hypothetical protein
MVGKVMGILREATRDARRGSIASPAVVRRQSRTRDVRAEGSRQGDVERGDARETATEPYVRCDAMRGDATRCDAME